MNVKKLKFDEEVVSRWLAWPRFILGATLLAIFATCIFLSSIVFGYSLKGLDYLKRSLRLPASVGSIKAK